MNYDILKKIADELLAMSAEQFHAELESHKDGDIATLLRDGGFFYRDDNGCLNCTCKRCRPDLYIGGGSIGYDNKGNLLTDRFEISADGG